MYNKFTYWSERANPNRRDRIDVEEQAFLGEQLAEVSAIGVVGPGRGRLFPCYEGRFVVGWDIVGTYVPQAVQRARACGIDYVALVSRHINHFLRWDYEAVVCANVLLHEPDPRRYLLACRAVTDKLLLLNPKPFTPEASHCFNHDYPTVCQETGWDYTVIEQTDDQEYAVCNPLS